MFKRFAVCAMATSALMVSTSGGAFAASESSEGQGNGAVGCTLAGGLQYENPAAMLKYLAGRDGSFQNTVDKYSSTFASVGDLIDKKCGA